MTEDGGVNKRIPLRILRVPEDWDMQATRIALSSLSSSVESLDAAEVIRAIEDIVRRRRAVLPHLRQWERLKGSSYWFTYNCPPAGVITEPGGLKPCMRSQFCPFCWCRQNVLSPYHRLRDWLFDAAGNIRYQVELCEVYDKYLFSRRKHSPVQLFDSINRLRQGRLRKLVPFSHAAFVMFSVGAGKNCWIVRANCLLAIPPSLPSPADIESERLGGCTASRHVLRQTLPGGLGSLASTMGRIGSYPASILKGRHEDTLQILRASAHCRTREFYGQLRGRDSSSSLS